MLTGTLNKIREEKASRIRDVEYIREMSHDDSIDDRFFDIEMRTVNDIDNIYEESVETINQIPIDETFRHEEITRMLNSDRVLSFDEMIGIDD